MISAAEALQLNTAQLSPDELAAADRLEAAIEELVRQKMERRGIDFATKETNNNVIAEVNQRLKRAGFEPSWQQLVQQHRLNKAQADIVGWQLFLAPNDESYKAAARSLLS